MAGGNLINFEGRTRGVENENQNTEQIKIFVR